MTSEAMVNQSSVNLYQTAELISAFIVSYRYVPISTDVWYRQTRGVFITHFTPGHIQKVSIDISLH